MELALTLNLTDEELKAIYLALGFFKYDTMDKHDVDRSTVRGIREYIDDLTDNKWNQWITK